MNVTAAGAAVADADAVAASGPRDRARVVTPGGKSTNRNADPANGVGPGKVHNNPAGCKDARQNPQDFVLGAGPRAAGRRQLEPLRQRYPPRRPLVADGVRDNADFAHAAALCPAPSPDTGDWHTSVASAELLAGNPHCSSDLADGKAGTSVHSLSKDSAEVDTDAKALDCRSTERHTEVGPREVALPKVKPRRRARTLPEAFLFMHQQLLQLKLLAAITQERPNLAGPRKWPTAWPLSTASAS